MGLTSDAFGINDDEAGASGANVAGRRTPTKFEVADLSLQRSRWLLQVASVPNLQCGKDEMFPRMTELLKLIADGDAVNLDASPELSAGDTRRTWRQYASALRPIGLIEHQKGPLRLTASGEELLKSQSKALLATQLAVHVRLFAEVLGILVREPLTVEEANAELVDAYGLDWTSVNNTRLRMTWLEVLGLVEWLGDRKQRATSLGRDLYATWETISPAAVTYRDVAVAAEIADAPVEISNLLDHLRSSPGAHDSRNTYNIWVPSPKSAPTKIENMRTSITAAAEPIEKEELLGFIAERFELKRSSVDSMLPFMRAGGFLQEVRRGVFVATPAAKAWLQTGSDLDFIRILHGHMRFVGELVLSAKENTSRNDVYAAGARYGMNKDKIRWLIAFMIEAGLLVETTWAWVQATPTGMRFITELPLAEPVVPASDTGAERAAVEDQPSRLPDDQREAERVAASLIRTARDPGADGRASGAAFELSIESAFAQMGFRAQRISGSGDTDVLVQWYDSAGVLRTAVVDGKSTASGQIDHTSVHDVAISSHKDKHAAEFVAIIAPSFAGGTIRSAAEKMSWALITAEELGELVKSADMLGLQPAELGVIFETPDGLSRVADLIEARQRELEIITLVISRLREESETDEAVSPRDISLIERRSTIAPSIDELLQTFQLLTHLDADIVRVVDEAQDQRHETYQIGSARAAARRLRALATAIERGA